MQQVWEAEYTLSLDMHKGPLKPCDKWAMSWEDLFLPYANNKGADQPAHLRSLISTFVVRCPDSILSLVSVSEISSSS